MMSSSSSYSSGFPLQMSSILKSVFIVLIIFSGSAQPQGAVENEKVEIQLVVKEHRLVDMVCRCNDSSHLKGILEEQMKCMDTYEKTEMKTAGQTEAQIEEHFKSFDRPKAIKMCSDPTEFCKYKDEAHPIMACIGKHKAKAPKARSAPDLSANEIEINKCTLKTYDVLKSLPCKCNSSSKPVGGVLFIVSMFIGSRILFA